MTVRWTGEVAWLDTTTPDDRILSSTRTTDNPWYRDLPLPVMYHHQDNREQLGEVQAINITDGIVYATGTATGHLAEAMKTAGPDGLKAGIRTVDGTMDYEPDMIMRVQDWTIAAVHVGDDMNGFPGARIRITPTPGPPPDTIRCPAQECSYETTGSLHHHLFGKHDEEELTDIIIWLMTQKDTP